MTGGLPRPDEVLVTGIPTKHVGFGIGPHRCIGSHLGETADQGRPAGAPRRHAPFRVHDHGQTHWVGSESRMIDRLT